MTEFQGLNIDAGTYASVEHQASRALIRGTAPVAESFSRLSSTLAAVQPITAQAVYTAVRLAAGDVITTATFTTNTTAGATLTNQFASIYSSALAKLAVSADLLATAAPASTEIVFTFSPYTILADGLYYIGLANVATTVPTYNGVTGIATVNARTPAVAFTDTGHTLTNAASSPATATASAGFSGLHVVLA